MNRIRQDIDVLKRIVEVRHLQKRVSEQALAEATLTARSARAAEHAADSQLSQTQNAWLSAVRQARFDPNLMGAFTEAVHQAGRALEDAREQAANTEQQREARGAVFQRAEADTEAAEEVRNVAQRTHRRRREENRLNEVSDSVARRRSAP